MTWREPDYISEQEQKAKAVSRFYSVHLDGAPACLWRRDIQVRPDQMLRTSGHRPVMLVRMQSRKRRSSFATHFEHVVDHIELDSSLSTDTVIHSAGVKIHEDRTTEYKQKPFEKVGLLLR